MANEKYKFVFVVGAGASVPFGFPTGAGMKSILSKPMSKLDKERNKNHFVEMCGAQYAPSYASNFLFFREMLSRQRLEYEEIVNRGMEVSNQLEDFIRDYVRSGEVSIDAYTACQGPEAEPLARLAIAAALGPAQRLYYESMWDGTTDPNRATDGRNWIDWIFRQMRLPDKKQLRPNFAAFITFNYDTVLETELKRLIMGSFHFTENQANEELQKVPIHHIYGHLDLEKSIEVSERPFSNLLLLDRVSRQLNLMRFSESNEIASSKEKTLNLLRAAENLVCLGFGFDPTNCKLLELERFMQSSLNHQDLNFRAQWAYGKTFASAMGLEEAEAKEVQNYLYGVTLGERQQDCLDFLRSKVGVSRFR